MTEQTFKFRPTARILSQLGDQLIRNEKVAMLELIKNSYDADSPFVRVTFSGTENPETGSITVYDEGEGMDTDTIRDKWLIPGTDYRKQQYDKRRKTPRFNRTPLGEKGVGRFAVQKLGLVSEITSRREGQREIFVVVDWRDLGSFQYLDEFEVHVEERNPKVFTGQKTGTQIVIRELSVSWNKKSYRRFHETSMNFSSPFATKSDFRVEIKSDHKDWDENAPKMQEYLEDSIFRFKVDMKGDRIIRFQYKFTPPPEMTKLKPRELSERSEFINKLLRMQNPDGDYVDLDKFKIGILSFEGYMYDRDPLTLKMSTNQGPSLKRYLDKNGGVRVYRDGIRVYDYGEPGNDWLELGIRRINQPVERISNNIILAAVTMEREASADLQEKTNREGFVENDAFTAFCDAVRYALKLVETQRNQDKRIMRKTYGRKTSEVLSITGEFKEQVNEKVKDVAVREEFLMFLERIETGYSSIRETFIKSAISGLAIGIALHEIEKIVEGLMDEVKNNRQYVVLRPIVKRISDLVEGYGYLLRKSHRVYQSLSPVIDDALFDVAYRLKKHNITVIVDRKSSRCKPKFSRQMITGALLNLIDNAIWWLDYSGKNEKFLYISVTEESGKVSLLVADNGTGFTLPTEMLGEPFISAKPDGIGLGLHVTMTIMGINDGKLLFPDSNEVDLPEKCRGGAILELRFNNVEEC